MISPPQRVRNLAAVVLACSACIALCINAESPYDYWIPVASTPTMGHTMSPSTQTIDWQTAMFTLVATVTDKDTFERSVEPNDTQELAGNENDVNILMDFTPSATNYEFNATTGERKRTYIFTGPFGLIQNPGQIAYSFYRTAGRDSFTSGPRHDSDTNWSTCVVAKQYVPVPGGGGG
jgi:hypothetical protein